MPASNTARLIRSQALIFLLGNTYEKKSMVDAAPGVATGDGRRAAATASGAGPVVSPSDRREGVTMFIDSKRGAASGLGPAGAATVATGAMTGAEGLLRTVSACGVRLCFANPGTSEMHFLAALERVPDIRPVLGLFEGAVTGMADGYARVTGTPAMTLLHLGPGFANGIANLHNARRAKSPVVNVVGDHATYHNRWDSALKTDVAALARPASDWLTVSASAQTVAADGARAVAAALERPGRIATLILPADTAWGQADGPCRPLPGQAPPALDDAAVTRVARILRDRGNSSTLFVRGAAGSAAGLAAVGRICARTGARAMMDLSTGTVLRGRGRFPIARVPYRAEDAVRALHDVTDLILVGAQPPVAPFAYPDYPSWCVAEGTALTYLAHEHEDEVRALEALAEALGAGRFEPASAAATAVEASTGVLDAAAIGRSVARHLPEDAIVSEEAISNAFPIVAALTAAPPHLHLALTGGAIGQGIPLATGAAVAAPGRKVVNIQADGSAMYTLQALWTQARERLDVVTIILANRSYAVLRAEVDRVGATIGAGLSAGLLDIDDPALDWVALARGMGIEGCRATSAEQFDDMLASAMAATGPRLIEAAMRA